MPYFGFKLKCKSYKTMQNGVFLEHIGSFTIFKTDFSFTSQEIYLFLCFIFLGGCILLLWKWGMNSIAWSHAQCAMQLPFTGLQPYFNPVSEILPLISFFKKDNYCIKISFLFLIAQVRKLAVPWRCELIHTVIRALSGIGVSSV